MNDINKYYEILGLKSGSSKEDIKHAYKDLLNIWNPSKHADDVQLQQKAQEKIKEIDNAYEKILLSLSQIQIDENESVQAEKSANIGTQQLAKPPQEENSISQKGFQKPRPWVRFWARTLDLNIFGLLLAFLIVFLYALIKVPPLSPGIIFVLILSFIPIVFVIDAISMTLFGNTPGKAILRTSVTNADGSKLSFRDELLRNMRVYFSGYGLGIPLVQLVTFIVAYNKLTNKGKTSWDEKHNFIVSHGYIGGGRVLIYCVGFLVFLIITALSNIISEKEMKTWVNAEIEKSNSDSRIDAEVAPSKTGKIGTFYDPWEVVSETPVVALGQFLVPLAEQGRFLKMNMQVELSHTSYRQMVTDKVPQLRHTILGLLRSKSVEYLTSSNGKLQLEDELLLRVNMEIGKDAVKSIVIEYTKKFFTESS